MIPRLPRPTLFPYTTLFRSQEDQGGLCGAPEGAAGAGPQAVFYRWERRGPHGSGERGDRKSTRLNSSHVAISYAVFCLKKKNSCFHARRFSLKPCRDYALST